MNCAYCESSSDFHPGQFARDHWFCSRECQHCWEAMQDMVESGGLPETREALLDQQIDQLYKNPPQDD